MNTCYAHFDATHGSLLIGNAMIEKKLTVKGGLYRTEYIRDKLCGTDWTGGNPWQKVPFAGDGETVKISFNAIEQSGKLGIKPHLESTLVFESENGDFRLKLSVFPDVPFILSGATVTKKRVVEAEKNTVATEDCSGIEKARPTARSTEICDIDTLECVPLSRPHLEVESICLFDKTDINDMLVERQTAPVYSRGSLERNGNLFCINDYPNGNSLLLVKHSPTASSALHRINPDLIFRGTRFVSLMGNGIDYATIPCEELPTYSSAVGIGQTEEIWDHYMQYCNCFGSNKNQELFVMSNTWGDRSQDTRVCESFILEELDRANILGVDIMQIDDGWQKGISANSLRKSGGAWEGYYDYDCDFWQVDPIRFPNGLTPIVKKAEECGVEVGLWFSPDSSRDFANVEQDIKILLSLYKKHGIRHFKLDGIKIRNKLCEKRLIHLLESVSEQSDGNIQFNLDVTAEDRFGYLYEQQFGTLFVENRYSDWGNYYPHCTFRNLWDLAGILPGRRLQMELLNIRRNREKYAGSPFAPDGYSIDYLFATVMVANPLVWAELTGLCDEDADLLGKMISLYKPYKKELYSGRIIPIGKRPNGMSFSGYQCESADGSGGHLILFREITKEDTYTFALPRKVSDDSIMTVYQSAEAQIEASGDKIKVTLPSTRSFVWLKYKS